MKKSKFTESQIVNILKQAVLGQKVNDICREHGICDLLPMEEQVRRHEGVKPEANERD